MWRNRDVTIYPTKKTNMKINLRSCYTKPRVSHCHLNKKKNTWANISQKTMWLGNEHNTVVWKYTAAFISVHMRSNN